MGSPFLDVSSSLCMVTIGRFAADLEPGWKWTLIKETESRLCSWWSSRPLSEFERGRPSNIGNQIY